MLFFQTRRPNPEEAEYNKNCFFLGTASSLLKSAEGEQESWGAWKIEAVAYVDKEEYRENIWGQIGAFASSVNVSYVEQQYAQT